MQLSGELAKVNVANLLQLVKTGGLTGKITFSQGAKLAVVLIEAGIPVHAETEGEEGVDGLMELFLWTSGAFSFNEESLSEMPVTIDKDDPETSFEQLLRDGIAYQEAKQFLDQAGVTPRSVLIPTGSGVSFAKHVLALPGLERLDGQKNIAEALGDLHLTKRQYVRTVATWLMDGVADLVQPYDPDLMDEVELPGWVISRLKQDNTDVSQAIVDLVIWADRVKCWMFQVDVDFYRIRKQISESTGGSTEMGMEDDLASFEDSVFAPPAEPPPGMSSYSAVAYSDPNFWQSTNYYQGGNLFKTLDAIIQESGETQDQPDTTSGGTSKDKKDPDSTNQRSIEF